MLLTSESGVDFDAIDNRPVDIFIALFVPEDACNQHLSTLQDIAKMFSDKQFCKLIRQCDSSEALYELLATTDK